ncbi:MAG: hypothetical protein AW07_02293 [Candidatus Accumulibacter sp. SK-11]|nr:MAG: hypothetical protein AW07_02293 [Candidatus Accumulibacter sp. SK-11]
MHTRRLGKNGFTLLATGDQLIAQSPLLADLRIGLGNDVGPLLDRRQVLDLIAHAAVDDLAVRGLEKTILVGAREERQRVDQADVRTLWRFDRANPPVVRRMHVTHLESGALARQTAGAKRRDATLVGDLGQRVGLVHELRQLARTEELAHGGADRLGVDQIMRHQVVRLGLRQALLDRTLDAHQAGAELVLRQFTDRTYPPVTEMVDVVDLAAAVAQLDEQLDHFDDIARRQGQLFAHLSRDTETLQRLEQARRGLVCQVLGDGPRSVAQLGKHLFDRSHRIADHLVDQLDDGFALRRRLPDHHLVLEHVLARHAAVELHAADSRQVVAVVGVEQPVEQNLDGFLGRRLARSHHAVDGDPRRLARKRLVRAQGL